MASLQSLPDEIVEAAEIDGASRFAGPAPRLSAAPEAGDHRHGADVDVLDVQQLRLCLADDGGGARALHQRHGDGGLHQGLHRGAHRLQLGRRRRHGDDHDRLRHHLSARHRRARTEGGLLTWRAWPSSRAAPPQAPARPPRRLEPRRRGRHPRHDARGAVRPRLSDGLGHRRLVPHAGDDVRVERLRATRSTTTSRCSRPSSRGAIFNSMFLCLVSVADLDVRLRDRGLCVLAQALPRQGVRVRRGAARPDVPVDHPGHAAVHPVRAHGPAEQPSRHDLRLCRGHDPVLDLPAGRLSRERAAHAWTRRRSSTAARSSR